MSTEATKKRGQDADAGEERVDMRNFKPSIPRLARLRCAPLVCAIGSCNSV